MYEGDAIFTMMEPVEEFTEMDVHHTWPRCETMVVMATTPSHVAVTYLTREPQGEKYQGVHKVFASAETDDGRAIQRDAEKGWRYLAEVEARGEVTVE